MMGKGKERWRKNHLKSTAQMTVKSLTSQHLLTDQDSTNHKMEDIIHKHSSFIQASGQDPKGSPFLKKNCMAVDHWHKILALIQNKEGVSGLREIQRKKKPPGCAVFAKR